MATIGVATWPRALGQEPAPDGLDRGLGAIRGAELLEGPLEILLSPCRRSSEVERRFPGSSSPGQPGAAFPARPRSAARHSCRGLPAATRAVRPTTGPGGAPDPAPTPRAFPPRARPAAPRGRSPPPRNPPAPFPPPPGPAP